MEKHIYIFKSETGECKIGVSNNVNKRRSTIEMQGNNKIIDFYNTPKCFNAHEIENIMHQYFDEYRGIGEWFSVDFQEACDKLSDVYDKYAIKEIEDNIETLDYHSDKTRDNNETFIIYLSNDIINNSKLTDVEFSVYVALRSIYTSKRATQFVSYNMIAYELFGHSDYSITAHQYISNGLNSLIKKELVSVVKALSKTELELDMNKLYFNFDEDDEYYTVIKRDEVHKIMNISNKMNKFKLLRYFATCLRTCRTQGTDVKKGIVGFMSQEYLCELMGVSFDTNFKLLLQYNKVLEDNKIMYIYHRQNVRRTVKGQIHSLPNHYGRYEDMNEIIKYAVSYEKYITA